MSTLYIMEQGALLKKSGERLLVVLGKEIIAEKHFRDITRVLLFGNIQMTTQVVHKFLQLGIHVAYFTMNGSYRGQLSSVSSASVYTKMAQISHWSNKQFLLALARQLVMAKIQGQRYVLQKRRRGISAKNERLQEACNQLEKAIQQASAAPSTAVLRGIEGNAARVYFSIWDELLPKEFPFEKRSRRPAHNGMNSALNFSYTLLLNEVNSMLELYGFDVMLGFYHSIRYGRISLSLDVMELFRPLFIDQWLLSLARQKQIQAKDFYWDEQSGMYFTSEGRKKFLTLYEQWHKEYELRTKLERVLTGLERTMLKGDVDAFRDATEEVLSHLL
ncbi:CRISPR-associated endonuclease Cas1 [Geobacillus lituanicus]|nr:CRISPR-associated endonuclease Cas1 [Geobacillus lituanicus]